MNRKQDANNDWLEADIRMATANGPADYFHAWLDRIRASHRIRVAEKTETRERLLSRLG